MEERSKITRRTYVIDHTPIKMDYLVVGTQLPFDVYTRDKSVFKLTFPKGHKYNSIDRNILKSKGISEVYVDYEVMPEVNKYKKKNLDPDESLSPEKKFDLYVTNKEKSYYIGRKLLIQGRRLNFSLYEIRNLEMRIFLQAEESSPVEITSEHLDSSQVAGDIVINKPDIRLFHQYINELIKSEHLQPAEKALVKNMAVVENFKIMIDLLLNAPGDREILSRVRASIGSLVNMVSENLDRVTELLSKGLHNYFVNVHSVNVAIMAAGLGLKIGMKTKDVNNLALGALLHDIGMSIVPPAIINRMGRLTENEFQVYKGHVIEGEKLLKADRDIPDEAVYAAVQHHEKLSKKGYPMKLSPDKIKLYGRITAICDCYDAVTTGKAMKAAISSFEAMSLLAKESDNYDPALIRKFIGMITGKL